MVYSLIFSDYIKNMHICHGNLFITCQDTNSNLKSCSSKDPLRSLQHSNLSGTECTQFTERRTFGFVLKAIWSLAVEAIY